MFNKITMFLILLVSVWQVGCASVPMASVDADKMRKEFSSPPQDMAGLYIYRNTMLGCALKKTIVIDGVIIGETASMTYFYKDITPGHHDLSTESEFSNNVLILNAESGNNYFVHQCMKMGVFVGGAKFEIVPEEKGKKGVLECKLAK